MKKALIAALIIGATGFAFAGQATACVGPLCENGPKTFDLNFTLAVPRILEFTLSKFEPCTETILFDFVTNDLITTDQATTYWRASNGAYRAWLKSNDTVGNFASSNAKVPHIAILSNVPGWKLSFKSDRYDGKSGDINERRIGVFGKATKGSQLDFNEFVGPTPQLLVDSAINHLGKGQGLTEFDLNFSYKMKLSDSYDFDDGLAGGNTTVDLTMTLVNPG